MLVIDGFSAAS